MTVDRYTDRPGTDVAPFRPDTAPTAHQFSSGVTDLAVWAQQADAAHQLASGVCNTSFVSAQYRNKPDEAAAAILVGSELGFSPMTSLRGLFDNIQGVTAPRAITQRAVLQSKGHDIWVVESTDERCVMRGRRMGSEVVNESVWTIERAQKLGLTTKDQWKKQPKAMLIARCTAECSRLTASDALLGIPYSAEELHDDPRLRETGDEGEQAHVPPQRAVRGATRVSAADLTGEPATTARRNRKQLWADLKAAFDSASVSDRDVVSRIVLSLVDRKVDDLGSLTDDELEMVVGELADLGVDGIAALAGSGDDQPTDDGSWPEVAGQGGASS